MPAPFVFVFISFACGVFAATRLEAPLWTLFVSAIIAVSALRAKNFRIALAAQFLFLFLLGFQFLSAKHRSYNQTPLLEIVKQQENETIAITGQTLQTPE